MMTFEEKVMCCSPSNPPITRAIEGMKKSAIYSLQLPVSSVHAQSTVKITSDNYISESTLILTS